MLSTSAMAQTATGGAAPANDPMALVLNFAPFILLFVLFYFLMIRPQQRRAKQHQATLQAVKRGDTVVMTSGIIGKVTRVEDAELAVEIAPNTVVKVVRSMIADVRTRSEPAAANDVKS